MDTAELKADSTNDTGDDAEVARHACARVQHTTAVNTRAKNSPDQAATPQDNDICVSVL